MSVTVTQDSRNPTCQPVNGYVFWSSTDSDESTAFVDDPHSDCSPQPAEVGISIPQLISVAIAMSLSAVALLILYCELRDIATSWETRVSSLDTLDLVRVFCGR